MCWRYTLTLPLSLVFPSPVSPIYSSLHLSQMTTYMKLKLSHVKRFFNLKVIQTFLKVFWDWQALSGDFQCTCGKMDAQILLDVQWCGISIFHFLKFCNFIKGIMRIHNIFKKPKTNVFILHLLTY